LSATVASPRLRALIERAAPAPGAPADASVGAAAERCELCAAPLPPAHRHVVDLDARRLLCACRACSLLFDRDAAGGGHYRLVPDRCARLEGFRLDDLQWRALDIPVAMAFFVRAGEQGRVTAFYPSPAGVTESQLPLESWSELEAAHPALAALRPDVEALLVNGVGEAREAWLVGVDRCYRLVALVRAHWRGFGGGPELQRALEGFFDELRGGAQRTG
jgi:uncharacterized protein DUF5947